MAMRFIETKIWCSFETNLTILLVTYFVKLLLYRALLVISLLKGVFRVPRASI